MIRPLRGTALREAEKLTMNTGSEPAASASPIVPEATAAAITAAVQRRILRGSIICRLLEFHGQPRRFAVTTRLPGTRSAAVQQHLR